MVTNSADCKHKRFIFSFLVGAFFILAAGCFMCGWVCVCICAHMPCLQLAAVQFRILHIPPRSLLRCQLAINVSFIVTNALRPDISANLHNSPASYLRKNKPALHQSGRATRHHQRSQKHFSLSNFMCRRPSDACSAEKMLFFRQK
jgi:hypothetical protein